jgi:hypothetical protein
MKIAILGAGNADVVALTVPYDVGPLTEARLLEPFALVWIHLAVRQKMGTGFAFRLMRR